MAKTRGKLVFGWGVLVLMGCVVDSTVKMKVSEAEERSRNVSSGQALLVTDRFA